MVLRVDADSLQGDGRNLAALGSAPEKEGCPAPAGDPVSTSMAFALSGHDENLCDKLRYAKLVREHGGALVTAAGVMFEVADDNAALEIDRVEVDHEPRPSSAAASEMPLVPRQPPQPPGANIPAILSQTMEPERFADAIHSGQGAGRVRDFSDRWRKSADDIAYVGDRTIHVGNTIDEHWPDNASNAASNVRDHGGWMHTAAEWGQRLSDAARMAAVAFDYARADTPTPKEFDHARAVVDMQRRIGTQRTIDAAEREFERLKQHAALAGAEYQMRVQSAVTAAGRPISSPPLIARSLAIPGGLVKGPGEWTTRSRRDGEWRDYERHVTGYPAGMEYAVSRPDGPVDFDGFETDAGTGGLLVEAKGNGYAWQVGPNGEFDPTFKAAKDIPQELQRQYQVAIQEDIPVEWRVAEPQAAAAIQAIIDAQGYGDMITVAVVPVK